MMKYCTNCGAELTNGAQFCTKCGEPIRQGNARNRHEINKKSIYVALSILIVIITVLVGKYAYLKWQQSKKVNAASQEMIVALQKAKSLIPINVVLEIFKVMDKEFTIEILEEYGYHLEKIIDGYQYWVKKTEIQILESSDGSSTTIKPLKETGSLATVCDDIRYFRFYIEVYSKKDFDTWVNQLYDLGYKEESYGESYIKEDGWTILGAHSNKFKLYEDGKGNSIEMIKDGDGSLGYGVYTVTLKKIR